MILAYTGDGKGKTSACVGQTIRALGQGMDVAFAQFMKRDGQAGEQAMLSRLLGERFRAGGEGFFRDEEERPLHRRAALDTLAWAEERISGVDMLVLDESLYALGAGLLTREEMENVLEQAEKRQVHVALSGRGMPDWLKEAAHLITEMREIKHPWRQGVQAVRGIEF